MRYIRHLGPVLLLFLSLLKVSNLSARESFQLSYGEKVSILSDKAFRKKEGEIFEAIGNVVIAHGASTLYGEKATLSLLDGNVHVVGNVRYIGNGMTLYGSELSYNFKSEFLEVKNSRIIAENYNVLGREISRVSSDVVVALDAEYTTCRDCPESWTIYGKRVHITTGQYVRIEHAFLKAKGVIVMYFPYIIFPIKKERESGLLFPKLSFDLENGATFQQPVFWAINPTSDLTFTPSVFARNGVGSELQFRKMFGESKWVEFNSLNSFDRVYLPEKNSDDLSGDHYSRLFAQYEQKFTFGNSLNHHFYYNGSRDLDMVRDYDPYLKDSMKGSYLGGGGFFDGNFRFGTLTFESYFHRNQFVENPKEFDHSFVQVLPKVSLSTTRFSLVKPEIIFFRELSSALNADMTIFRQNHVTTPGPIRNAERLNLTPYLNWDYGDVGPVNFQTRATLDYQEYRFPYETLDKEYKKSGVIYQTEASFGIEKIYGMAYKEEVSPDQVDWKKYDKEDEKSKINVKDESKVIGSLPKFEESYGKEAIRYLNHSYKYGQDYKLVHYFTTDQRSSGNLNFNEQIKRVEGRFDSIDSIRDRKNELATSSTSLGIPTRNTLEVQWNNSFIKKSINDRPLLDLSDQSNRLFYNYKRLGYFNLSQGWMLEEDIESDLERLTRLAVFTGLAFDTVSFDVSEYYLYLYQKHVMTVSLRKNIGQHSISGRFTYDSLPASLRKFLTLEGKIVPIDVIHLKARYDYNIENKLTSEQFYDIEYRPLNNCWMIDFTYNKTQIDSRYSVNFAINYNTKSFAGVN